jgi:hypothetical protein
MANTCCICEHPQRAEIDQKLGVPRSDSRISREYGWNRATIARHRAHSALKELVEAQAEGIVGEVARLKALAENELRESKDPKVRLAAQARLQSLVELEHRLRSDAVDANALYKTEAFGVFLTHLLNHLCGECRCRVRDALPPGDTRSE